MCGREPAYIFGVAGFDLQRGVGDLEAVLQFIADVMEKPVVEAGAGPHQMHGQRGFGRAHGPDVEIMHFAHTGKGAQIVFDP